MRRRFCLVLVKPSHYHHLRCFFITDDNCARNKDCEQFLDRLIYLREQENYDIGFIIQVDTYVISCRILWRNARVPGCGASSSASRTSTRLIWPGPKRSKIKLLNTGRCCSRGKTHGLLPTLVVSSAFPTTRSLRF